MPPGRPLRGAPLACVRCEVEASSPVSECGSHRRSHDGRPKGPFSLGEKDGMRGVQRRPAAVSRRTGSGSTAMPPPAARTWTSACALLVHPPPRPSRGRVRVLRQQLALPELGPEGRRDPGLHQLDVLRDAAGALGTGMIAATAGCAALNCSAAALRSTPWRSHTWRRRSRCHTASGVASW